MSKRTTAEERILYEAISKFCSVEQIFKITAFVLQRREEQKTNASSK